VARRRRGRFPLAAVGLSLGFDAAVAGNPNARCVARTSAVCRWHSRWLRSNSRRSRTNSCSGRGPGGPLARGMQAATSPCNARRSSK